MTASEYQALEAKKKPPTRTSPPTPPKEPRQPAAPPVAPEIPKSEILTSPSIAATHYIGRYQLNVANGTHYPGRARIVIVGPASEALTAALVAALHQFTSKP